MREYYYPINFHATQCVYTVERNGIGKNGREIHNGSNIREENYFQIEPVLSQLPSRPPHSFPSIVSSSFLVSFSSTRRRKIPETNPSFSFYQPMVLMETLNADRMINLSVYSRIYLSIHQRATAFSPGIRPFGILLLIEFPR